jgi:ribosomal protein S18 acetylase RimI-like enzyme
MASSQPMTFRCGTLENSESLDEFCAGVPGSARLQQRLADDLAAGTVRPRWCRTAYDEGNRAVARHYWWGPENASAPVVLVPLDSADPDAAAALALDAIEDLHVVDAWSEITIPGATAGDPWTTKPGEVAVLEAAGFRFQVDRVRVEWIAGTPLAEPTARLTFAPADGYDDGALVALFASVADGSLDHAMQDGREHLSDDEEARKRVTFLRAFPGVDDRFVIAVDADSHDVGYVVPALSPMTGVIAEIGVAGPSRGNGYVHDLLAHATSTLSAAGATRIVADTDCANTPMRAAFRRAGYREFARRWDWGWRRD